jgi:hypothetical protein
MASEHRSVLKWSINVVCGAQDIIEFEVPEVYFIT